MTNWGQSCLSPEIVYAHKDIKPKLLDKLKEKITQFYGTDPHKSPDYTRIVNDFHLNRLEKLWNA